MTEDDRDFLGVHLAHCNFGDNSGSCKYGDANCPALTSPYSWIGKKIDAATTQSWPSVMYGVNIDGASIWGNQKSIEQVKAWHYDATQVVANLRKKASSAPNLLDPAVQKRLAEQWGYVPAGSPTVGQRISVHLPARDKRTARIVFIDRDEPGEVQVCIVVDDDPEQIPAGTAVVNMSNRTGVQEVTEPEFTLSATFEQQLEENVGKAIPFYTSPVSAAHMEVMQAALHELKRVDVAEYETIDDVIEALRIQLAGKL